MKAICYNSNNIKSKEEEITKTLHNLFYDYLIEEEPCTIINTDLSKNETSILGNTYSYFIRDNLYYYTSMVDTEFRKVCYDAYDFIINNRFQCELLDKYSYTIKYYPYIKQINVIQLYQVLEQLYQIKDLKIDILSTTKNAILQEYKNIALFINKPELINKIENNLDILYHNYSFSQGSAAINRLLVDDAFVFYDYIAVYKIKPRYTSIYRDLAQLYISILDNDLLCSVFKKWCISKNLNLELIYLLMEFEEEYFING